MNKVNKQINRQVIFIHTYRAKANGREEALTLHFVVFLITVCNYRRVGWTCTMYIYIYHM